MYISLRRFLARLAASASLLQTCEQYLWRPRAAKALPQCQHCSGCRDTLLALTLALVHRQLTRTRLEKPQWRIGRNASRVYALAKKFATTADLTNNETGRP